MANIFTTTSSFNGAAAEASQVVAVADDKRKYIGLYSLTGSCKVSFGEVTHSSAYIVIAEGNMLELAINPQDKVQFSTTGTVLRVIQDIDSKVVLSSDSLALTSDGYPLTYAKGSRNKPWQPAPVFA